TRGPTKKWGRATTTARGATTTAREETITVEPTCGRAKTTVRGPTTTEPEETTTVEPWNVEPGNAEPRNVEAWNVEPWNPRPPQAFAGRRAPARTSTPAKNGQMSLFIANSHVAASRGDLFPSMPKRFLVCKDTRRSRIIPKSL